MSNLDAVAGSATRGRRSLFGEILDWMLAPLLLLWPISLAITWLVAKSIANQHFDHALTQRLQSLSQQVYLQEGTPRLAAQALRSISLADDLDLRYLQVRNAQGHVLDGDPELPLPPEDEAGGAGKISLRTIHLQNQDLRLADMWLHSEKGALLLQLGETTQRRTRLTNDIIRGVILPQFFILPLALFLVWFALSRGLSPLSALQKTIRQRQLQDLSPIQESDIPQEISPLVLAFNEMLARFAQNLQEQQRFIADAAHQMKTPLAGMRMQAELAINDAHQQNLQEVEKSLQQLVKSSENATRLVNQLLTLARAETLAQQAQGADWVVLDLATLARHTLADWVGRALALGIDLGLEADEDICEINGQPTLLREMINNLLDNALRYCQSGAAQDLSQHIVTLRVRRSGDEVVLEVEDNGPGIAPAERDKVFARFYRTLGTRVEGSGLGLAIVREIAQQHGAAIAIFDHDTSQPGAPPGCRIQVRFPAT